MSETGKTKAQKAAERAARLESLTEEQKRLYRKRKSYVGVEHSWYNFFSELKPEDVKELILAIIKYDETGEVPELSRGNNAVIFKAFIKSFIDRLFDDFCLTCLNGEIGKLGGERAAILRLAEKQAIARYHADTINGVKIKELMRKEKRAIEELEKGLGKEQAAQNISVLDNILCDCELKYYAQTSE